MRCDNKGSYKGGPYNEIVFSYERKGDPFEVDEFANFRFHSNWRQQFHLTVLDIADFFLICQKALADGVIPRNIKEVCLQTFRFYRPEDKADSTKAQLARELVARKYLPYTF